MDFVENSKKALEALEKREMMKKMQKSSSQQKDAAYSDGGEVYAMPVCPTINKTK